MTSIIILLLTNLLTWFLTRKYEQTRIDRQPLAEFVTPFTGKYKATNPDEPKDDLLEDEKATYFD